MNKNMFISEENRNLRLDFIKVISCLLIVFLHNTIFSGGESVVSTEDNISVFFHTLTRVAVPAFMGVSGYLLFFENDRPFKYGFKSLIKYLVIFALWEVVYLVYNYFMQGNLTGKSVKEYLLNIDISCGNLWYLKLYVVILAVFPIIKCIVKEKNVLWLYIIFWIVFGCARYSVGLSTIIFPRADTLLMILQLPLFEYHGYVGGNTGSEHPTVYIGLFIIVGAYIGLLENKKVNKWQKCIVELTSLFGLAFGTVATVIYSKKCGVFTDYFFQPTALHILVMSLGFLTIMYSFPEKFLERHSKILVTLSRCSLGIYIIHPLISGMLWRFVPNYGIAIGGKASYLMMNLLNWVIVCLISTIVSYLICRILPPKVSRYII